MRIEYDPEKFQIVTPEKRVFKMLVNNNHADYYQRNGFEGFTADLMLSYLKENSLFIDIGAHYGYYSLLLGTKYKDIKIYAFEPAPENYEILKKNFWLNGLDKENVYNLAISNKDGIDQYQITTHSSHCGFYQHSLSQTIDTIPVECATLDNCIKEFPKVPTIIKIDTEGHEICVLEGMKNILANTEDVKLFIEFNPPSLKMSGSRPEELLMVLTQLGFDIYFLDDERRESYKIPPDKNKDWESYFGQGNFKKDYFNILCVRKPKSLSVCLFSHASGLAGAERSLLELTTELIRDHGAICTVALPNNGPLKDKLEEVGASTLVLDYSWWSELGIPSDREIKSLYYDNFTSRVEKIETKIGRINPDVVMTNTMVIPWGAITASILGKPHVWFVHEFGSVDLKFYLPLQQIIEIIRASSDLIFTNSNAVRKALFGERSEGNIYSIYQYIDLPDEAIHESNVTCFPRMDATKLIVVGRISPHKGQEDAILAVRELIQRGRDVELFMIGSAVPWYLENLKKIVSDEKLGQYVRFGEYREDVYPIISQADIVLTCTRNEAFGRVTLEAMLLKKSVIGANAGGTPELIKEGFNGLLYEPGDYCQLADRIEYLINNKEKIREYGENGYLFAKQNFTKENFGGKIYGLLKNLKDKGEPVRSALFQFVANHMFGNMSQLRATVEAQQQELNRIHVKLARILVRKYQRVRDKLFPLYSRRRQFYIWIDTNVRMLIEHGWVKFFYLKYWPYRFWISKNEPTHGQLLEMQTESRSWAYRPLVSLVTPVFNPTRYALTQCLQSVLDQTYDNWELCIVDGGSDRPYVREVIERFARNDPRIKYAALDKNHGIAGNANEALRLASGDYVGFLDHDDTLAPFALHEVVKRFHTGPMADVIYSDEDKVPAFGAKRYDPEFKSEWAPDTFLSYNYLCHFAVVRKKLLDDVGGFREGYDGAQDYDLMLRLIEKTKAIQRIPKVLYHWRAAGASTASGVKVKPYAISAAKKAIGEHLSRRGLDAEVLDGAALGSYRVKYRVRPGPKVCIIIPTKDKVHLLKQCVSSVLDKTSDKNFKIIIVDNRSEEKETFAYFDGIKNHERIRVLPYDSPFNFSAINNYAVRSDDSEYLVFLNNDTEVISADWFGAMLEFAQRDDVGAVGAKLYFPNDTIQHAGTIIGYGGIADHAHKHFPRSARGYMGRINIIQNLSAVTAACMMVCRKVFDEVGGYDEELSHSFNDVDLCLKMRERGYLIIYTPYAELYHHESISRGYDEKPEQKLRLHKEVELIKTRWKHVLEAGDPYYNPNLSLERNDFSLKR